MRAAKPIAAVLTAAALMFSAVPAQAMRTNDATNIHFVDVVNFRGTQGYGPKYVQRLKDDVLTVFAQHFTPVQFATTGHRVYVERQSQRIDEGSYFNGYVYCWHSDVGADPNATMTADGIAEQDAAALAVAVEMILADRCSAGP